MEELWSVAPKHLLLCFSGVDHRRQSAGESQPELWDGVPAAGCAANGAQRPVVGLRHRGENRQPICIKSTELFPVTVCVRDYWLPSSALVDGYGRWLAFDATHFHHQLGVGPRGVRRKEAFSSLVNLVTTASIQSTLKNNTINESSSRHRRICTH